MAAVRYPRANYVFDADARARLAREARHTGDAHDVAMQAAGSSDSHTGPSGLYVEGSDELADSSAWRLGSLACPVGDREARVALRLARKALNLPKGMKGNAAKRLRAVPTEAHYVAARALIGDSSDVIGHRDNAPGRRWGTFAMSRSAKSSVRHAKVISEAHQRGLSVDQLRSGKRSAYKAKQAEGARLRRIEHGGRLRPADANRKALARAAASLANMLDVVSRLGDASIVLSDQSAVAIARDVQVSPRFVDLPGNDRRRVLALVKSADPRP